MNATQWALNLGIRAAMLSQLGVHAATRRRLVTPLLLVGVATVAFLPGTPTQGSGLTFESIGVAVGLALGLAAAALMRVRRDAAGHVTITAGWAYALLWTTVIGGRIAFALWATGPGARQVGAFSMVHGITGPTWTAFFVLMALAMIAIRTAVLATLVVARRADVRAQYA